MKKKILSLVLAIATTFSLSANVFAADENTATADTRESVLAAAEMAAEGVATEEVSASSISETDSWISEDEVATLAQIGVDIPDTATVETVISEDDGMYEKIYLNENDFVCVDENNAIFRISNFGNGVGVATFTANNVATDVDEKNIAEMIRSLLHLTDEYTLESSEEFDKII